MKKCKGFFKNSIVFISILIFGMVACKQDKQASLNSVDVLIANEDQLTQIIIYDVFT